MSSEVLGKNGCVILQPYDLEVTGIFLPPTTLRSLGPKPWKAAYVQPSRRPTDGRHEKILTACNTITSSMIIKPSQKTLNKFI